MSSYIARGSEYEAPIPTTENDATLRAILQRLQYLAPQQGWRGVSVECDPYRETVLVTASVDGAMGERELRRFYDRTQLKTFRGDAASMVAEDFVREFARDRAKPERIASHVEARIANEQAHGPVWIDGTPRTSAGAQGMLSEVEPRHALRERLASRRAATEGRVVLEPSPRVTPGEPMPAATMPAAEWREAWRAAEVPALCALRERCEASGARPVIADWWADSHASVVDRYARAPTRSGEAMLRPEYVLQGALCVWGWVGDPLPGRWDDVYQRSDRADPLPSAARGWCPALTDAPAPTAPVDPATADATWQAMRAACPERVYPEPTGESE